MPVDPQFKTRPQLGRRATGRKRGLLRLVALISAVVLAAGAGLLVTTRGSPRTAAPSGSVDASLRDGQARRSRRPHTRAHSHVPPRCPRARRSGTALVGRRQFAAELAYLRTHGYHAVTLGAVYDCWTQGRRLPTRPVVLSFDDGYLDQYRYAAPLLRSYGDPDVLNLIVHNLGRALTLAMVSRMADWGWEIDSHTITHRDLTRLRPSAVAYELKGSRDLLRGYFHVPVDFFCYPGGAYDAKVEGGRRHAGYLAAASVEYGLARPSELFALRRIVVVRRRTAGRVRPEAARLPAHRGGRRWRRGRRRSLGSAAEVGPRQDRERLARQAQSPRTSMPSRSASVTSTKCGASGPSMRIVTDRPRVAASPSGRGSSARSGSHDPHLAVVAYALAEQVQRIHPRLVRRRAHTPLRLVRHREDSMCSIRRRLRVGFSTWCSGFWSLVGRGVRRHRPRTSDFVGLTLLDTINLPILPP